MVGKIPCHFSSLDSEKNSFIVEWESDDSQAFWLVSTETFQRLPPDFWHGNTQDIGVSSITPKYFMTLEHNYTEYCNLSTFCGGEGDYTLPLL